MKEIYLPIKIYVEFVIEKASSYYKCSFLFDQMEDAWIVDMSKIDSELEPKRTYHRSIFYPKVSDADRFIDMFITKRPLLSSVNNDTKERSINIVKSFVLDSQPKIETVTKFNPRSKLGNKANPDSWHLRVLKIVDELHACDFNQIRDLMIHRFPGRTKDQIENNVQYSLSILFKRNKVNRQGQRGSFTYLTLQKEI